MSRDASSSDRARTAALSTVAGVGGVAGSYAVAGGTAGFLAAPFAGALARYAPAVAFRYLRSDVGSTLQGILALALAVGSVAVIVAAALAVASRVDRPGTVVPIAGVGTAAFGSLITGRLWPALGAGLGAGVVLATAEVVANDAGRTTTRGERRRILSGLATAIGLSGLAAVLADRSSPGEGATPDSPGTPRATLSTVDRAEIRSLLSEAAEKSLDVSGIEPLVSEDFYTVDINRYDPTVSVDAWSLRVSGSVESVRVLDYPAIRGLSPEHRFVTLRCVSDPVNGTAIDTALFTGVPVSAVLEGANPQGEYVLLHAADGYSVGFPLAAIADGLLAYGMNGRILPRAHGFPLRALVPGHWGETNAKWLTEIEITDELVDGYWESRGWEGTGPVHTVAKIHAVNRPGAGRIEVGGPAYAGTRGVSAVEVSTDGGRTWQSATLSEPLPGDDVWRQWRYEYDAPAERHAVVARAIEGDGTVQPRTPQDAFPGGATGYARRVVRP
ncbi:MAG: molybdopterin-dependent oxidoreductase [Halanaeroarchaeum sp.]